MVPYVFLPLRQTPKKCPSNYKEIIKPSRFGLFPVALVLTDDPFTFQARTRWSLWRPVIKVPPTLDVILQHRAEGGLINRRMPRMRNAVGLLCFVCTECRTNSVVFVIL